MVLIKNKNQGEHFASALAALNEQQLLAVNRLEGPVMVLAGPGTGKTQILAARIGQLLASDTTQALPQNILCLTFTEAGTVAMRRRLLEFIGPDAYKVNIYTFHSFCNRIIQEHPDLFGLRDVQMISDIEEVQLLRKLVDGFPLKHPLKRFGAGAYYDVPRLKKLFGLMKTEDWSADFIYAKADLYLSGILTEPENYPDFYYKKAYKNFKAGDIKEAAYKVSQQQMEELKAAAASYVEYAKLMKDLNRYDYQDMILWVLKAFKENEQLLKSYQEQFQYILVDEYQDTNDAQNEIVSLLCSYWPNANVFVVGDDDQSIYRFQGANIQNILNFNTQYEKDIYTVVLRKNYRSTQPILDAAKVLISKNKERITTAIEGLSKDLESQSKAEMPAPVAVVEYFNPSHETVTIANEVEQHILSGVKPSDIAIIYRNHKQVEDLLKYFQAKNIVVNLRRKVNILKEPFIQKLITILTYIEGEYRKPFSQDHLLYEILHYDFWAIEPLTDISKLMVEINHKRFSNQRIGLREALTKASSKNPPDLFSEIETNRNTMAWLSSVTSSWIKLVPNVTLQNLFERVITEGKIITYALEHAEKVFYMEMLTTFFNYIKEESTQTPHIKIETLIKNIALMEEYNLSMEAEKLSWNEEGVMLTTAHSSKGLEFDFVYIIGCTRKAWDEGGSFSSFKFPDNLYTRLSHVDETEENRRLFYVGMTRARKNLQISYPQQDLTEKKLEPSIYVTELLEGGLELIQKHVSDEQLLSYQMLQLSANEIKNRPLLDDSYLDKLLEHYTLSVSHLSSYIECPVRFYYNNLIRVPSAKSAALSFGNAVHKAYEYYFKNMKDGGLEVFQPVEELIRIFKREMHREESAFTPEDFKRRTEYGEHIIKKHHELFHQSWNKVVVLEYRMNTVLFGEIPLKGVLDKIEFNGLQAKVVDYKTGIYKKGKFKRPTLEADAKKEELFGGDYWRQAVFYKILLDHDSNKPRPWEFETAEFDFLEPDKKSGDYYRETVVVTSEDERMVTDQIKDVYRKIKNKEFVNGCGECEWCKFGQGKR
jgi:DNA helicase-2/ATP-dependent DNA helicase PcrA